VQSACDISTDSIVDLQTTQKRTGTCYDVTHSDVTGAVAGGERRFGVAFPSERKSRMVETESVRSQYTALYTTRACSCVAKHRSVGLSLVQVRSTYNQLRPPVFTIVVDSAPKQYIFFVEFYRTAQLASFSFPPNA